MSVETIYPTNMAKTNPPSFDDAIESLAWQMSLHLFKSKAYLRVQVPQRIAQIGGPRRRHVGSALQQFFVVRKAVENEHGLQTLLLQNQGWSS